MRAFKLIVSCAALAAMTSMAVAQNDRPARPAGDQPAGERPQRGGGPGGPGGRQGAPALSPEKAKAAQELQATAVAKRLGLDDEKSKAVAKSYTEARESYTKAQEKLLTERRERREDSDGGRGSMEEWRKSLDELNKTEREKLEKALSSSMSSEQVTKASASLGALAGGRQWDNMTNAITEFKLDADKQQTALNAVEDFVVAQAKTPRPGPDGDVDAFRKAMDDAREKLNTEMKKLVSEEQLKKFEETTRMPGRRGGGAGGGGGGGRRGGGEGDR